MSDRVDLPPFDRATGPLTPLALPPLPPPSSGPVIPGFELLEEIGRGGMGVVYKARQRSLNRTVALKVVIGGAFASPTARARFRMEAEALARLHHPNVVQVHDVGEHGGVAYIAFEYIDGPTLRRWQEGVAVEPRRAARMLVAIARAVQHAHEMGIIHRDLKPGNVLLAGIGTSNARNQPGKDEVLPIPKVGDFGLAKLIDGEISITASGVACGTPNYMSPEQVRGGPAASLPTVDVWGLGAVLFEMLTGRTPFAGGDATAIMQEIALFDPPDVRSFAPNAPSGLSLIVSKCLEKNPARRYATASEAADDLERYLAGETVRARRIGVVIRAGRWTRRNPVAAIVGMVLIGALASVSAVAVALQRSADRERLALAGEQAARVEEERLRFKADAALRDAEKARDDTRRALASTEKALSRARAEQLRAEKNLAVARQAVAHVLSTATTLGEQDDPALIPVYRTLLAGLDPFVAEIIAQKSDDRGIRFNQFAIARTLGILEDLQGRTEASQEHMLIAVSRIRDLAKEEPASARYQLESARTLALAGAILFAARPGDAKSYLAESRLIMDQYLADRPKDVEGLHEMIRVRLSMNATPGGVDYTDEHDRAVLDLVDRLTEIQGPTANLAKTRAHAINNIASDLTNRGKTDEAEAPWLDVLRIREGLFAAQPNDRITRYELGKCLANYANQLAKTGRGEGAFRSRERAAEIFDSLHGDARHRTTYISIMLDINFLLGAAYLQRSQPEKAAERWTKAIALTTILLGRDPKVARNRGLHADAHTRRAEIASIAGRHADAARDFRIASEFSTRDTHRDYCSSRHILSLAKSGDRTGATALALTIQPEKFAHPQPCVELAKAWLIVAKSADSDPSLSLDAKRQAAESAVSCARSCVLAAQKKGWFQTPVEIRTFHAQAEFEPIWDVFPRQ